MATKKQAYPHHRGSRHLKLGVSISAKGASIKSIWVVDQPAVQATHFTGPIYVRIDVAGKPVLLQALPDPRICRGVKDPKLGHFFHVAESALMFVTVPFDEGRELAQLRVRILDATHSGVAPVAHQSILHLFDRPPQRTVTLGDFSYDTLRNHADFPKVAKTLGWVVAPGSFEIIVEPNGRYRWRVRRSDNTIMAESAQDFATRTACEEDIRWVKANAMSAPISPRDTPGN
jgi:uncharacterized protein YegP (UPF0339 family)